MNTVVILDNRDEGRTCLRATLIDKGYVFDTRVHGRVHSRPNDTRSVDGPCRPALTYNLINSPPAGLRSCDQRVYACLSVCLSARIDIAYSCTEFDDFRFSRSSDMIGAPKFCNGSYDLTTPQSGTVCCP